MGKEALPLCSTCHVHEKQMNKVNFMWGAGWFAVLVAGTIFALIIDGQNTNKKNIESNTDSIIAHERIMQSSVHELEQTLTIMSINQKRQMEASNIPYLDPERVHRWEEK